MRTLSCAFVLVAFALPIAAQVTEWQYDLSQPASAPTLYPDEANPTGIVLCAGPKLLHLKGDGAPAWEMEFPSDLATPPTVADLDQDGHPEIVVALHDGTLVCLDEQSGQPNPLQERWRIEFDTPAGGFKHIVAADVHPHPGLELVFGFDDGWLNCLGADGKLLWRFFGDRFRVSPPAVGDVDADGHPEIIYGTDNGHVYCLNGFGSVQWRHYEFAPYGRSGPNITDLDNDGTPEVLITRSNVGLDRCLMALDGKTGKPLWRTQDVMQGYVSNAVVSFGHDPNTQICALHADKGNWVYCVDASGKERWRVDLGGRGVFWAPAAADIDGDGYIEVIVGMRGQNHETGACAFVLGQDGTIDAELDLGNDANASPAIGDIDGDGELEVIVVTQGPNRVHCLTWNAGGRVEWPSGRGDSRMTAAKGIPTGTPEAYCDFDVQPSIDMKPAFWGQNNPEYLTVTQADPAGDFVELAMVLPDGTREVRVLPGDPSAYQLHSATGFPYYLTDPGPVTLRKRTAGPGKRGRRTAIRVEARPPETCGYDRVAWTCREVLGTAREQNGEAGAIEARLALLKAEHDTVAALREQGATPLRIAEEASALRNQAAALESTAKFLLAFWAAGGSGTFAWWPDPNPWGPFDPRETPRAVTPRVPLKIPAYGNEFEDAALTLLNVTSEPLEVRCMFAAPQMDQGLPNREPDLAKRVTLRRAMPVPAVIRERVFDALPELDRSRTVTLPPSEARQLWLVVDTHGLEPGIHELTLYLGSLTKPPTVHEVPVQIEVWPVALPTDVFAKMNWSNFNVGQTSDQAVQDMISHGISSIYGPPLPQVPVDAQGNLAGEVDWTRFDESLARVPKHFFMLWGSPPARRWPEGVNPAEESPEFFNGFKTAIAQLAQHLTSKDFDYDRWAFYPIDEPWNTGFTHIPPLRKFCKMVKRADLNAQNYTDPCGLVRPEYLDEFKDLIDIWQPEMNTLKRDPELVAWFQKNAKHFWAYEAPAPAKDFPPLGHYRAFSWLAWSFGCEGAGYWIYKWNDVWWPITSGDWSAVYQTNDQVVPSRRWEADRDGAEDYRALHILTQEIDRARKAGRTADADRAQALIDEAVEGLVGWISRNIDEITRMTRDYEIDYDLLMDYRTRVKNEILRLRQN